MPRIAVVGLTVHDVVYRPGVAARESPGGGPLFAVSALREAGLEPAGVATRCRDARLVRPMTGLARPLCLHLDAQEMVSELRYHEDGERDHRLGGLGAPFTVPDLEGWAAPALAGAVWIHAATQHAGDLGPEALAHLAAGGRSLALDAQGPLRAARLGPVALSEPLTPAILRHLRALKLSEVEAEAAFGTLDPAAIRERTGVPEVLVTLGPVGARVAADGERADVGATPVLDVDPTGAGDAFLTLYAEGRAGGATPIAAAQRACELVSAHLLERGGRMALA